MTSPGKLGIIPCLVLAAGLLLPACFQAEEEGPPLPAKESMTIDLSIFETKHQALFPGKADDPLDLVGERANFNNAAVRVGLLNGWVVAHLTGPALVWGTAMLAEPVWENGKWVWDFEATFLAKKYQSVLSAWYDGNLKEGVWLNLEMEVTCLACPVPTDNYLWYTGRFNTNGNEGYWLFNNPEIELEDQSHVRIDYEYEDTTHKSVTATNIRLDGHETANDEIVYEVDGDTAHVSVHDESDGLDYVVEWSITTMAGWVQVPGYNGGDKSCWDALLVNTDCP